jgi:hypothetical protein
VLDGQPVGLLLHPDFAETAATRREIVFGRRHVLRDYWAKLRRPDNSTLYLRVDMAPVVFSAQPFAVLVGTAAREG